MKQNSYIIINEDSMSSLVMRVNHYLNQGWVTSGGISYVYLSGVGSQYLQALVREENNEKE